MIQCRVFSTREDNSYIFCKHNCLIHQLIVNSSGVFNTIIFDESPGSDWMANPYSVHTMDSEILWDVLKFPKNVGYSLFICADSKT